MQDQRIALALGEKTNALRLLVRVTVRRGDDGELARRLQGFLDAAEHGAENRPVKFGNEHTDAVGAIRSQGLGEDIGAIVELLHGGQDPFAGLCAHLVAVIDDPGHRGQGHPGRLGDVVDRRHSVGDGAGQAPHAPFRTLTQEITPGLAAGLEGPFLGVVVDAHNAEALRVAEGPFEIVHETPVEQATYIDTLANCGIDGQQVRLDVGKTVVIHDLAVDHVPAVARIAREIRDANRQFLCSYS